MKNCDIEKCSFEECVQRIVLQNRQLITRIKSRGFRPGVELDFTDNGAGILIRRFFEAVAVYEEGCVPSQALKELFVTTEALIGALKLRKEAPVCELDAVGVAFREAAILWRDTHPKPQMPRNVYLKKHFAAEAKIYRRLEELHAEYVRIAAAKGRKTKTMSIAAMEEESSVELENHRRIFAEIDRLVDLGNSIAQAIKIMMNGTYASRMRGVKDSSWKRYYLERNRRKNLMPKRQNETVKSPHETVNETVNLKNETVNRNFRETVNLVCGNGEEVDNKEKLAIIKSKSQNNAVIENDENETVKSKIRETVKIKNETINETVKLTCSTVKRFIRRYPGVNSKRLVGLIGKSRATVMRFISELKTKGEIEFKGSAKSGGYFTV